MKTLYRVFLFCAMVCIGSMCLAQNGHIFPALDTNNVWTGQNTMPVSYTVAKLPVSPLDGTTAIVTDGNGVDCTTGGGLTLVLCRYSSAAATWQVVGGGNGSGAVSSVFGRSGVITAQTGDYLVSQVTGAAPIASPTFTGTPAAPTAATSDNSTTIATTAYVKANLASYLTSAYQTIAQGGVGLTGRPTLNFIAGTNITISCADNSASTRTDCTFSGSGTGNITSVFGRTGAITAQSGDYTVSQVTGAAPLASPTFTGTPSAPTPATADNSTTLATTAYVKANLGGYLTSAYQTIDSNGTGVTQRGTINFIQGTNMTVSCVDNGVSLRTDCTFTSTGGGGGGTPGGSSGQLQGNNANAFGGVPNSNVNFSTGAITLGAGLTLNPTTAYTGGALAIAPTDTTTPAGVFNCANALSVDCFDLEINGAKEFFLDSLGQINFSGSTATAAAFVLANGAGTPPSVQGNWWCIYPSCFYYDGSNTQQIATNNQNNVFNGAQTFQASSAAGHAAIFKAAASPSGDVTQVQDSSGAVQAKIDSNFNFWAPAINTNGIRNGTYELSAQNSDPATDCTGNPGTGKGCVDAQSWREEIPNTATSYRELVPNAAPASPSVRVTDSCAADANGTPKCTDSFASTAFPGDLLWFDGANISWLAGNVSGTKMLQNANGVLSWVPQLGGGTVTTSGAPVSGNLAKFSGATAITNGDLSGDVTTSGTLATTIANGAVTPAKQSTNAVLRSCVFDNDTQSATVLTNANLTGRCMVPSASTVIEVDVWADGGTPQTNVEKVSAGVHTNLLAAALATGAAGAIACDSANAACYGGQAKTAGISVNSLAAGDIIQLVSGTAGGVATRFTVQVWYTVN